jgi:flavodoxin I
MKVLILYDSQYGNTEQIAKAIAGGLGTAGEVRVLRIGEAKPTDINDVNLLIVGSPTQGSKATTAIQEFLDKLLDNSLKDTKTTAFDTRMTNKIIRMFGYAAPKIAKSLEGKGATQQVQPEGFWVKGSKGPLKEGELERASKWGKAIATSTK